MTILYRGTRDGFGASVFHRRCDNKGPTVVLVRDTEGWIFGGYSAIPWKESGRFQEDSSGSSFIFTLKNPHGTPPQKFLLKDPQKAIYCYPNYGPTFGAGHDIRIYDDCKRNSYNYIGFPSSYADPGGQGQGTFCGHQRFVVSELEVFAVRG
jgi:hypothetical protein